MLHLPVHLEIFMTRVGIRKGESLFVLSWIPAFAGMARGEALGGVKEVSREGGDSSLHWDKNFITEVP